MLKITVSGVDSFDESSQQFTVEGGTVLELEHSLVSLSKWESIFEKPFLGSKDKTPEEILTYVKCMCLDPNIPPELFYQLSEENFESINKHIDAKMTATWFSNTGPPKSSEVITADLIYYWMTVFQIPFECENWHLNRLFTLIQICNTKQAKPKKMSRGELAARNRELNAQRKQQLGTTG